MLHSLHPNYVAQVLGNFDVEFDDRELEEDKNVKVLMLEKLDARPLSRIHPSSFTSAERKTIRNAIIEIVKLMFENDSYFPSVSLHHFLVLKDDHSIKACGLGITYHPAEYSLSKEEQDAAKRRAILEAIDELDDSGWC